LDDLPAKVEENSVLATSASLILPVSVEGVAEGKLLLFAEGTVGPERAEQIRILASEAATMLAERRSRRRNEDALRQAKFEAESANRAKSMLLANMSHEIRTPMTGVLGFAELLASTQLTAGQRDYVETIRSSGQVLLTLINDILDFSKIEAGQLQLETLPVDVCSTVENVMRLLEVQASEKRLRFSSVIDPAVPPVILGDGVRLRQILVNLLGNAVKFTAAGEVSLAVTCQHLEDRRYSLRFIVRDTGPGISPEDRERIFDSFSQVDASISRRHGGTGLGLAISMALAKQMGGSLWVESEVGKGSAFHFSLVVQAVADAVALVYRRDIGETIRQAELPELRVIVADDNQINLRAILALLRLLGYRADSAANGRELLECVDRADYDVVLMDVQMPELDGIETARLIRRNLPRDRQPHIIALTAAAFPEDRMRCLEAGMNDYVAKPVDTQHLVDALRRAGALASAKARNEITAKNSS
jgi:signal transduction histidine kinase/CheY-like chemotaxis protein